ncbi:MAG: CopG family transcriptional regulator [Candidatus Aminicenantes bacterium]|nr:CopG family transcriptional regulator [Candidatus Aminicenantes bacterium]MDH5384918.1 CopG family transcriptional regulator [Candidatus Aminicenantes bacterium]MDH5743506.1 CopG family transcriptional regulator [Candidatus Aminicenantes bacterium]
MSISKKRSTDSKVTIKIPGPLYNRIAKIVAGSGFNSVTDFIVYVLRDLVSTKGESATFKKIEDDSLSKEEIEAIRKRLKSLGYL